MAQVAKLTAGMATVTSRGFKRDQELDFSDDGNRFCGYTWNGKVPLTQCYSDGEVYLCVRDDYMRSHEDIPYGFWEKYPESKIGDEYNGTSEKVDLDNLVGICDRVYRGIQQAKADFDAIPYPDMSAQIQNLKNDLAKADMLLGRNLNWFEMNLSKSGIEAAFKDYKHLKEAVKRDEGVLEAMQAGTLPKSRAYDVAHSKEFHGNCQYYTKSLNELIDQKDYSWYYEVKSETMK